MNTVHFNSLLRVMQPPCKGILTSTCRLHSHLAAPVDRGNNPYMKAYANDGLKCYNNANFIHHKRVNILYQPTRYQVRKANEERSEIIHQTESKTFSELTVGQKVKRVGKDAAYTGVVIIGIGVTGFLFYATGKELFSSETPTGIYNQAFKLCKRNTEIEAAFGTPLKCYGEMNREMGPRRNTKNWEFTDPDGVKHMRMKFYIEGPYKKGTVQLEVIKPEKKYMFRYLFVEVEDFPSRTIVIEDNR